MITTIIFDMGNVLIDFRWEALYHEMGLYGERFERMADATVRDPSWNEFDRGVWTEEMIIDAFIKNAPELEQEIKDFMNNRFTGLLRKFDYTDEWMDSLKRGGYKIYILSNFSEKAYRECANELDYIRKADGAVLSFEVNLIKPDPAIYTYLLDTYGIDPAEAVFIDDTAKNTEAARLMGINAILFKGKSDADAELAKLGVVY